MGIKAVSKEIVETNEEIRIFVFFFSCCIFNLLRINLRKKFRVWLSTYEFCEASRSEKNNDGKLKIAAVFLTSKLTFNFIEARNIHIIASVP